MLVFKQFTTKQGIEGIVERFLVLYQFGGNSDDTQLMLYMLVEVVEVSDAVVAITEKARADAFPVAGTHGE